MGPEKFDPEMSPKDSNHWSQNKEEKGAFHRSGLGQVKLDPLKYQQETQLVERIRVHQPLGSGRTIMARLQEEPSKGVCVNDQHTKYVTVCVKMQLSCRCPFKPISTRVPSRKKKHKKTSTAPSPSNLARAPSIPSHSILRTVDNLLETRPEGRKDQRP